jgi:hypothetical protein
MHVVSYRYMLSWKLFSADNSSVRCHHGNKAQPWDYAVLIPNLLVSKKADFWSILDGYQDTR